MRFRLLLAGAITPLLAAGAYPLVSDADERADVERLERKISAKHGKLAHVNGRARVLTGDISGLATRIAALQADVDRLQRREDAIAADLAAKRDSLRDTQAELRAARVRMTRLTARLVSARRTLAARLVEVYKDGEPDIITVVLDSGGFAELLENGAYLKRVGEQDARIITAVREGKAQATEMTTTLGALEDRQQEITTVVETRRTEVAAAREGIERRRDTVDRLRAGKRELLRSVRQTAGELHEDIVAMKAQQASIERRIRAAQQPSSTATSTGAGRFVWPVNGPITSPYCESRAWEGCHPGIDIAVATGTPIHAAGSGTVIMASYNGGYGNYTCVNHGGGVSSCYGHQSQLSVAVGQHVTQGEVIGLSGNTGFSTGPHLHFEVRVNGAVTQPLDYLG
ncbi:MAG TPA: peptidoglycan DD-metalloendopeptidase family protein [Conexibacter sp.]|jgi:murein DD-endopeptidase MepM/ murein hydrolase activator NlpD